MTCKQFEYGYRTPYKRSKPSEFLEGRYREVTTAIVNGETIETVTEGKFTCSRENWDRLKREAEDGK